ncbi:XrtA/PEP-CTERM system TPR-repeat protein PrsT [Colwellia sp. E2M01]|uniref:XrtA/PEP-CTERM system TPR-repeat protein PrsT n=1 Tax=Colwellia sp. E2M01 TaxID=2841561 RepID=UPI001C08448B|nr:XrtA/PEP-CTERM system TPR-repeat protein PrsT [Colwellia sp. E2M01]MBU2871213.1 PEP-CTERM system TPR-repeat protein PrsT [Colwellia sp. E2M01]
MKKLIITSAVTLALGLSGCSDTTTPEQLIASGQQHSEQGKYNNAIIDYKNAIQKDNKNAEVRFLLGQTYLNIGNGASAVKELERAQQYNYPENKVLPLLARAYILTGSDLDVIDLSNAASKLDNAAQTHYLAYKTLAQLRSEQAEQAKESVSLAKSLNAESIYAMLALAYLEVEQLNFDDAKVLISQILTLDAKQVDALMLQGQLAMVTKDYEQAAINFKEYLNLQPSSGTVELLLANALLKSQQYDEAEKYADAILARVKTQPIAHYVKAMVAFNGKDYHKASEHAEFAMANNYSPFNLKLAAGASAFYVKNWQLSYENLSDIEKYLPKDHVGRRMLSVTQLELGLVDEINTTVSNFEDNSDDSQFVTSLSYKLFELGAMDEAKQLLAHNNSASSDPAKSARQGILKLMMNDPSGVDDLEEAINLNPDFIEAELALGYGALQNNNIEQAKKIATKWQVEYPEKSGGYNLIATIAITEKKYAEAEKALKQSLLLEPDNSFALIQQLKIAQEQKNVPLSKQRVDYLINLASDDNYILRQYFAVYHNEMALDKLNSAYQLNKSDIEKALLVAEAMMSLEKYQEAETLLTSIARTPNLPKRYWQLAVFNQKRKNDLPQIKVTLEKWIAANPYHVEPIALLSELYSRQGNNKAALDTVTRGIENHKDNVALQLIKMQLLLESKQLAPAKALHEKLVENGIDDSIKQGLLGNILLLEKDYKQAIPKLLKFYQVYPSSKNVVSLASAYVGNKEKSKAIALLEEYLITNPTDNKVQTILAGSYMEDDTTKAIAGYLDVVQKQPKNIIAHNNLAWLYLEENNIEQALQHAQQASLLAPNIAEIADTYGKVLLKSGDEKAALTYAGKASDMSKGKNVDIQLNYAEILIANKQMTNAKAVLVQLSIDTQEQAKQKAHLQAQL